MIRPINDPTDQTPDVWEIDSRLVADGAVGPVAWRLLWGAGTVSLSPDGRLTGHVDSPGLSPDLQGIGNLYLRVEASDTASTATRLLRIWPDTPPVSSNPLLFPAPTGVPLPGGGAVDFTWRVSCPHEEGGLTWCDSNGRYENGSLHAGDSTRITSPDQLLGDTLTSTTGSPVHDGMGLMVRPGPSPTQVIDTASGELIRELPGTQSLLLMPTFSPRGDFIVVLDESVGGGDVAGARVYETATWSEVRTIRFGWGLPRLLFSPLGDELFVDEFLAGAGLIYALRDPHAAPRPEPTVQCGADSYGEFLDWSVTDRFAYTCGDSGAPLHSGRRLLTFAAKDASDQRILIERSCEAIECRGSGPEAKFSPDGRYLITSERVTSLRDFGESSRLVLVEDAAGLIPTDLTGSAPGTVAVNRWRP